MHSPVKTGLISDPLLYPYSSLKEALGKQPFSILDDDIIRLIGNTSKSQKVYQKFIYDGLERDLGEIESLFEKEEAVLGTERFATLAQKKYLRRRFKNNA